MSSLKKISLLDTIFIFNSKTLVRLEIFDTQYMYCHQNNLRIFNNGSLFANQLSLNIKQNLPFDTLG
jgi:hypothetical protein